MLISNPFASPLFLPCLYTVGAMLGGSLLVLLFVARFDLGRLRSGVLFRRWRVWAVIAPVYGLAILCGPVTTLGLLSLLVLQALREYARLVDLPPAYGKILVGLGLVAGPAAMLSLDAFHLLPPALLALGTLQPLLFYRHKDGIRHLAFAALGWGYIAWFLAHLMLIYRYVDGGPGILLAVGMGTALSDVGAFALGKALGKHSLAPRISPNKTWEGAAGNLLGAYLGIGLMAFGLPGPLRLPLLVLLPPVVAAAAIWGDLIESAIKREFSAKDAGTWLPGFGGLLDRVDSLIMVLPVVFYALRLLG
jgi:phosphatidate cytidylyltransferase